MAEYRDVTEELTTNQTGFEKCSVVGDKTAQPFRRSIFLDALFYLLKY